MRFKGLQYERVSPLGATMFKLARKGGVGKVPAIELDGKMIVDSTDIAYALDGRWPDPPLLPPGAHERGLCHAIEEWADESLYFIGLYYRWFEAEGRKPISKAFGGTPVGWLAYRFYLRRILSQLRGQGTGRKPQDRVAIDLERHLDAVERLVVPGPFTMGERPYLCDFALWGQLEYLRRTPVGGRAIEMRAGVCAYIAAVAAL